MALTIGRWINVYWDPNTKMPFMGIYHDTRAEAQWVARHYDCRCLYRIRVRLRMP